MSILRCSCCGKPLGKFSVVIVTKQGNGVTVHSECVGAARAKDAMPTYANSNTVTQPVGMATFGSAG